MGNRYLRWDELSAELPPQYLVHREWWLGIKLQRLQGRQEIGLRDSSGKAFTLGSGEFFASTLHELDRLNTAGGTVASSPSRSLSEQLTVHALREEAIASARWDGLAGDLGAARQLLRTGRKPENAAEQAVINIHVTLERIHAIRTQPLTLALLADLHQRITAGTITKSRLTGRLRQTTTETQPPAEELSARMKALLAFANGRSPAHFIHPLLRAAAMYYWMLHDQPFAEGNNRLARALYYWSVLNAGYPVFERLSLSTVGQESPAAFQSAFDEVARDGNDLLHFAAFLFEAIAKARRRSEEAGQHIEAERSASAMLPGLSGKLNARQSLLVARALKEPGFRCTLQEHARDHNLVRQTARHDFAPLVQQGWFEEAKVGRALTFFPVPDLAARLGHNKVD